MKLTDTGKRETAWGAKIVRKQHKSIYANK